MSPMFARITFVGLLIGFSVAMFAQPPQRAQLLEGLQRGLGLVRALPDGERPIPSDYDLKGIVGASRDEILKALALPTYCEPEESTDCAKSNSWKYEWGSPNRDLEAGDGHVTITTGGPWLLVIEFAHDRVIAAKWLGQR